MYRLLRLSKNLYFGECVLIALLLILLMIAVAQRFGVFVR